MRLFLVFAGNFIVDFVFGNFFRKEGLFREQLRGNPQTIGARNKRPDKRRKRIDNFLVRRIPLFLVHLKSPVSTTVGKNFASVFILTICIKWNSVIVSQGHVANRDVVKVPGDKMKDPLEALWGVPMWYDRGIDCST